MTVARIILLDAGVVGLLCSAPRNAQGVANLRACQAWLDRMLGRFDVVVPDVADFEVRRELIRKRATSQISRLDDLRADLLTAPVTTAAWAKAAEFWAVVRQGGVPTAAADALDADAILAGVAATLGGEDDRVVIATTNVRHLARSPGVVAEDWSEVA